MTFARVRAPIAALVLAAVLSALAAVPSPAGATASIIRSAGPHRFATAAALADAAFPSGASVAVVASGLSFPDALAASYGAGAIPGPVLLVPRHGDAGDATAAIRRLGVRDVVIVGGSAAIGPDVRAQIAATGVNVRTIAGDDRYATAASIAAEGVPGVLDGDRTAILANGENFPDALAASGIAFASRFPLVLTRRDALPSVSERALQSLQIRRVVVLGGPAAVGAGVTARLGELAIASERIAGDDRTQTAAAIATFATQRLGWTAESVVLASGRVFPDAVAAAPLSGSLRAPVLLTAAADDLGAGARAWLNQRGATVGVIRIAGGTAVVSDGVAADAVAQTTSPASSAADGPSSAPATPPAGGGTGSGASGPGSPPPSTTPTTRPHPTSTTPSTGPPTSTTTSTTSTSTTSTSTPTTTSTSTTSTTTTTLPPPGPCPTGHTPVGSDPPATPLVTVPELPLLHAETARGTALTAPLGDRVVAAKTVDGNIGDWMAPRTGFAGATRYACGELVYEDHVFDAYGADDGGDTDRLAIVDPLNEGVPETYRIDPIFQVDPAGELGIPTDPVIDAVELVLGDGSLAFAKAQEQYGDLAHQDVSDLLELRLAADAENLYVLARTTSMTSADQPAVVVLLDTQPGSTTRPVPFGSGLSTTTGDVAVFLSNDPGRSRAVDLATGAETPVTAVVNAGGVNDYTNAVEAAIPRTVLGAATTVGISAATGRHLVGGDFLNVVTTTGAEVPNVANVAFRAEEPVRTWFERLQALELAAGTIDRFTFALELAKLSSGATDAWSPGPGYHERVFESTHDVSRESGLDGLYQHYGVYLPKSYSAGTPSPMTLWMHWRGGKAHSAAAVSPRIMRDQGEALGRVVVAPRGRGTATWYLGAGHVDFLQVWDDAFGTPIRPAALSLDPNRVYVTGHSMGGWASYLLSMLYPDRFAASYPVEGPVTQGAFTGIPDPKNDVHSSLPWNCDTARFQDYTFCYVDTNDSDARVQHTFKLLENLYNVPIAIYQGAIDELVPIGGTTVQAAKLMSMQYRHRYYVFPTYEHYTHPIIDEWAEGARYAHAQTRPENPARLVYTRDMPFECSVEQGPAVDRKCRPPLLGQPTRFQFDFDRAYWMSELTAADAVAGRATVDARSLALPQTPTVVTPEAGGPASPGQSGPFTMTGLAWTPNPAATKPAAQNKFVATLTGASQVRFDTARMGLDVANTVTGEVTVNGLSSGTFTLRLAGPWQSSRQVTVNGTTVTIAPVDGVLTIQLAGGTARIEIS